MTLTLPLALVAAGLALAPVTAADHSQPCPEYTYGGEVPHAGAGVWFNARGQLLASALDMYVVVDEVAVVTGTEYFYSIWLYFETNGEPGLQRDDEYCSTEGWDGQPDTLPCFAEPRSAC